MQAAPGSKKHPPPRPIRVLPVTSGPGSRRKDRGPLAVPVVSPGVRLLRPHQLALPLPPDPLVRETSDPLWATDQGKRWDALFRACTERAWEAAERNGRRP